MKDLNDIYLAAANSLDTIITVVIILAATFLAEKFISRMMGRFFERSSKIINVNPTRYNFLKYFITGTIYVLGAALAIYTVPSLTALSISIFAGAGIMAVVVGFAAQQTFSNIMSGLFLVTFQPFSVGDRIRLKNDISGIVEDITLMHTIIRTFENKRIVIPNAIMSNEIIENYHFGDGKICRFVEVGISYDSDMDKAIKIMQEEALKHPDFLDNRTDAEKAAGKDAVEVKVISLGESSVILRANVWTPDPAAAWRLGCDLNKNIKKRFDKEGIEIPYPHRSIVFKNKAEGGLK